MPAADTPAAMTDRNSPVAWRGGQSLSANDLRGHLAALLNLTNVGVLLGAGASVPAGGQTMAGVSAALQRAFEDRIGGELGELELVNGQPMPDNVEEAWGRLRLWLSVARFGDLLEADLVKMVKHVLRIYESVLLDASLLPAVGLREPAAEGAGAGPGGEPTLEHHRRLLRKLVLSREPGQPAPWVFSLNYDLAIEWAAEQEGLSLINGFDGLHVRRFQPRIFDTGLYNTLARGEARFGNTYLYLAKLHGSLSWFEEGGDIVEHAWPVALRALRAWQEQPEADRGAVPSVIIPPSAAKYDATVGFVHGELFRRFAEFVTRPSTMLLCNGFGFADDHVVRLILGGLQNPTFHVVVCHPEGSIEDGAFKVAEEAPDVLKELAVAGHPCVTFVVGPESAYFDAFADLLPDPAIHDAMARDSRRALREVLDALRPAGRRP